MTDLQHKLADLAYSPSSESPFKSKAPIAFSICTEGAHIELWAHYTTPQEGNRTDNIVYTCHVSLPNEVKKFFMAVANMTRWAGDDFMGDLTQQLTLVEKAGWV